MTAAIEAVLAALAEARPDHRVAPSALIHVYSLTGIGDDGRPWVNLFYDFGGIGARHGVDGPDATGCYFLGGRSVIPQIEPLEAQYPFVVHRSRLCSTPAASADGGAGSAPRSSSSCSAMPSSRCAATVSSCPARRARRWPGAGAYSSSGSTAPSRCWPPSRSA